MPRSNPLESYLEGRYRRMVEADGFECVKLYKRRGWPDRLIVMDCGVSFFVEWKRRDEKLRKLQVYIANNLRELGHDVYAFDSTKEANQIYQKYKEKVNRMRALNELTEISQRGGLYS